ncbi:Zinc finger CCCH-type [Trinorchestia longiramus]|nr:Zinc finger CCCH-type [Trinorchestia longiramus]
MSIVPSWQWAKMAEYLASIFGTEKDKVNCSFYFKIGACRHGDRCSRIHNKPNFSQTVLILNLYCNPQNSAKSADGSHTTVSDEEMQEHYDLFFEEVFVELEDNYGEIEEMNVCDNLGDHLVGNVYIKFKFEEDAKRAVEDLNNRWFNRRPMYAELSPVTDFREACCRQYEMGECTRSGFCNFMHLKPISRELRRELYSRKIIRRSRDGRRRLTRKHKQRRYHHHHHHRSSSHTHHRSHSAGHRGSLSPVRRASRSSLHSRSPVRRDSHSPIHRGSRSPIRCSSRSPLRKGSHSPIHRGSRSPTYRSSRSPFRRGSRSVGRRSSRSPSYRRSRSHSRRCSRSPSDHRSSRSVSPRRYRSPPGLSLSPSYGQSRSSPRRSPVLRRKSPLLSNSNNSSSNQMNSNRYTNNSSERKNNNRSPLLSRKSPVILLKTPLLTPKTPLLMSSKAPLLPNKPIPLRRSPLHQRPPLIAKTPLIKSPLLAKPPLCSKPSKFPGNHHNRSLSDCTESAPRCKSPLLGNAPNCTNVRSETSNLPSFGNSERKEPARHRKGEPSNDFPNKSSGAQQSKNALGNSGSSAEKPKSENMNVLSKFPCTNMDRNIMVSSAMNDPLGICRSLASSVESGIPAHLTTQAVVSVAQHRGSNKAINLAESFTHHHGGFSFGAPHTLLGGGGTVAHHPHHLTSSSIAALHPFCPGGATITTAPSYPNTLNPSHPFSPLSSLHHHLPHTSTFSSPLLPGPPPTPLLLGRGGLLGSVMGGYGRGVMGGLLGHGGLTLGGFRLGAPAAHYGGRRGGRGGGGNGGGVTLQEQLAKAAAAVRLNRPY